MNKRECSGRGCHFISAESTDMTCNSGCHKLDTYNWLENLPEAYSSVDLVEVQKYPEGLLQQRKPDSFAKRGCSGR